MAQFVAPLAPHRGVSFPFSPHGLEAIISRPPGRGQLPPLSAPPCRDPRADLPRSAPPLPTCLAWPPFCQSQSEVKAFGVSEVTLRAPQPLPGIPTLQAAFGPRQHISRGPGLARGPGGWEGPPASHPSFSALTQTHTSPLHPASLGSRSCVWPAYGHSGTTVTNYTIDNGSELLPLKAHCVCPYSLKLHCFRISMKIGSPSLRVKGRQLYNRTITLAVTLRFV